MRHPLRVELEVLQAKLGLAPRNLRGRYSRVSLIRVRRSDRSGDRQLALNLARQARDTALERVEEASDPSWQAQAFGAIRATAENYPEFISDDVWAFTGLEAPREARALGPVFLHAVRVGWIRKTDRVKPSVRSHLSGKPIWRSLIFKG